MRTPSLRRRAVLCSVAVLALLLLVVGIGVDLALGAALRAEQRERLQSVAALAGVLTGLSDQALADRLSVPGIEARVTYASGAGQVVGVPQVPQAPPRRPGRGGPPPAAELQTVHLEQHGDRLTATRTVRPGTTLVLTADGGPIEAALTRFRVLMAAASLLAVAVAASVLPPVLGRAMRPLAALAAAAEATANGDRGRRLAPRDPRTDLGRAAGQFDAMLEELEGAERRAAEAADRLARFLSDASHELRTPLAAVTAGAERLIRDPMGDAERDRVAAQLVREARRGARLVDDLLLVSRLGELRLEPVAVDLRSVLVEARERRGSPAVHLDLPDVSVLADAERLHQVLANLLENAARAGATTVRVSAAEVDGQVRVRVSDDGPGFPAAAREAVFERLVRLDPSRSVGGAGLGLPIARGLAEAQGGTLTCVDPGPGDLPGAAFELTLPVASFRLDSAPRRPQASPRGVSANPA